MKDKHFYIVAAATIGLAYFFGHKIVGGIGSAVDAITPANNDNIFHLGVNAIGDILDDGRNDDSFSLGSWLFDLTHSDEL